MIVIDDNLFGKQTEWHNVCLSFFWLITEGFWDLLHAKDREEFTVNQFVFQYVLNYDGFMLFSRPVVKILFVRWETTIHGHSSFSLSSFSSHSSPHTHDMDLMAWYQELTCCPSRSAKRISSHPPRDRRLTFSIKIPAQE